METPFWASRPGIALALCAGLAMTAVYARDGQAQALKKVRIAYGGQTLNISYPWLELPGPLGYWKQEGYDVDTFIANGSLQAIQLLVAGQADIAQVNSAPLVQAVVNNKLPLRDIMMHTPIDWALVVPEDSPIRSIKDLKNQAIGTASLGTGGVALLRSYLSSQGLDPDRDVQVLPVGIGALALQTLKSNKVQGLFYWGSAIAAFENYGTKFRYLYDPKWRSLPDFSFVALQGTIGGDPKMIEGVVRGAAKASQFAHDNPECARRVQWKNYPESKPTGADEATLIKWDMHYLNSSLEAMTAALKLSGGKLWGKSTPDQFAELQDVLVETKLVDNKIANPADYVVNIPSFFERANDFDREAIKAEAMQCKMG